MPMFRAIGLVIAIIAIRILVPKIFEGLEATLIAFFETVRHALALGNDAMQNGAGAAFPYPRVPGT